MLFTEYELWQRGELDLFDFREVPEVLYKEAIFEAEKYLDNDWGMMTASMYTDMHTEAYFEIYRKRREALASLALAEHIEKKGRFLTDIIDGVWAICEESTWQLPDGSGNLRDVQNPKFDTNSARTAALLALAVHLFRKDIPVNVKKRMLQDVRTRVLDIFGEAKQLTPENTAYTLLTCIFAEPDEDKRRQVVDKTLACLDVFLCEYTKEGIRAKNEQSLYLWSAYIFDILEILYNVTDQKFAVYSEPKAKIAAESIYKAHIGNGGFSEVENEEDGARIYLFGSRMDYKKLIDFGASEFLKIEEKTLPKSTNLFHKLYSVKYASEIIEYGDNFDEQECGYIDSMDIFVKKTKNFSVAVKGGSSAAGNLMVYLDNEPYVVDLEKSHNLPVINGLTQFSNTKKATCEQKENGLVINLSETYPKDAGVVSWIRSVEAEEKYIIITDKYELTKNDDLKIILIMKEKPILSGDRILVGDAAILWDGDIALRMELVKSKHYDYVYRLVFIVKDRELKGTIRIAMKKN